MALRRPWSHQTLRRTIAGRPVVAVRWDKLDPGENGGVPLLSGVRANQ